MIRCEFEKRCLKCTTFHAWEGQQGDSKMERLAQSKAKEDNDWLPFYCHFQSDIMNAFSGMQSLSSLSI